MSKYKKMLKSVKEHIYINDEDIIGTSKELMETIESISMDIHIQVENDLYDEYGNLGYGDIVAMESCIHNLIEERKVELYGERNE